jgi:uncharacterized protein DUF6084
MASLVFDCIDVKPDRYVAAPTLLFKMRASETTGVSIHSMALRCQMCIEPQKRSYTDEEKRRLYDVFGEPAQWGETLKPFQLATVSHFVQGFTGSAEFDLPMACTYDLEVASGRFFDALGDGDIPLLMLFSGTVFVRTDVGFQVEQIPWDKEATFRLPAKVWREMIDLFFPGEGWLRLDTLTIDGLRRFKSERGLPTWDMTIGALLKEAGQ